jgi:hypothetical protein
MTVRRNIKDKIKTMRLSEITEKTETPQLQLFNAETIAEKLWKGMPEFNQKNLEPYHQIIVSFKDKEAMNLFSQLIDQKITKKTRSIWYPVQNFKYLDMEFVDES